MNKNSKKLNLTLEADSPEDFCMLLKQALYEIEKHIPSSDASIEKKNLAVAASFRPVSQSVTGSTDGTLGCYEFEIITGPLDYAEKEKELLALGYKRAEQDGWGFPPKELFYVHETFGRKKIVGSPAEICDFTESVGDCL